MGRGASSVVVAAGFVLGAGCTFGGLDDYEIAECDPTVTSAADDICSRLDPDPNACQLHRCDRTTKRCVVAPRDLDWDGDPDTECGGGDCNEDNRDVSSLVSESCVGANVDNDCDGLIDEDVLAGGSSEPVEPLTGVGVNGDAAVLGANGKNVFGTYVMSSSGGACVRAVSFENSKPISGCSFLAGAETQAPRQPAVTGLGTGSGLVYVATSGCPAGRIGYQQIVGKVGSVLDTCTATGRALPAIAPEPGAKPTHVALAYAKTAFNLRDNPFEDCADATPAPIVLRWVKGADGGTPELVVGDVPIADASLTMRPPAIVTSAFVGGVLVAVPEGDGVELAAVSTSATVIGSGLTAELADARAVSLATRLDGGVERFAIAAELGCTPQAIGLVLGAVSEAGAEVTFDRTVEVSPRGSGIQAQPSVAWTSARGGEWLVSWIGDGPRALVQRLSPSGEAIGSPTVVKDGATGVVMGSTGDRAFAIVEQPSRQFSEVAFGCNAGGS